MFALSHCPVSPCPIVLDFVSSGACLSCCPSLCLFFEGYVVRVLSSFFSLRTVSSPALQRLVLSSLARADFPPYSTSSCCAERAAVGSPTTSSTRRTTHHLTSVEHADPAERLRVTGIIHIDIGITRVARTHELVGPVPICFRPARELALHHDLCDRCSTCVRGRWRRCR